MLARVRRPVALHTSARVSAPARPAAPLARSLGTPLRFKTTMVRPSMLRADNIRSGGGAYSEREAALENLSARQKEKEDLERLIKQLKENPELAAALQVRAALACIQAVLLPKPQKAAGEVPAKKDKANKKPKTEAEKKAKAERKEREARRAARDKM